MSTVHVHPLPAASGMLAGRGPVHPALGVLTDRVQIYWRTCDDVKADPLSHAHERSDEFFFGACSHCAAAAAPLPPASSS